MSRLRVVGWDLEWVKLTRFRRFAYTKLFSLWFPEVDPDNPRALGWGKRFSQRDVALLLVLLLSTAVLTFNLSILIWALAKFGLRQNFSDIVGPHDGKTCKQVKLYNKLLHLGIDVLSTALLGASNYCADKISVGDNPGSSLLWNTTHWDTGTDWGLKNDWMCSAWAKPGERSKNSCTHKFLAPYTDTWTLNWITWVGYGQINQTYWSKVDYCLPLGDPASMYDRCTLRISSVILGLSESAQSVKMRVHCIYWTPA
jgi:hypothetical protein